MQIYDYTEPELAKCRELCNFTPDEMDYFNAKAKHKSNTQIALKFYWSARKTSFIAAHVKAKIQRVLRM